MTPDPGLPNLSPEEQAEIERLRERHSQLIMVKEPEDAAKAADELARVVARIKELTEKGRPFTIKG
jgi:hypothetical protein